MTAKVNVKSREIDGWNQFVISVIHPNQKEKIFVLKHGVNLLSSPFDCVMSCIFNVSFRSKRVNERLISVGIPAEYKDVQVELGSCECIFDHDEFMERFGRVLSDVSESIKESQMKNLRVDKLDV